MAIHTIAWFRTGRNKDSGHVFQDNLSGCPTGWSCSDFGGDNPTGSVPSYSGSGSSLTSLSLSAGGPGINTSVTSRPSEGFYYVYQSESGAFSLTAEDTGQTQNSSSYDNTGVMLRAGTAGAYCYAYILPPNGTTSQGGIYVDYMASNGGTPVNLAAIPESGSAKPGSSSSAATCTSGTTGNCYVGIERRTLPDGSKQLEAYWSQDNVNWQGISGSSTTLPSSSSLYGSADVGVAATSDSSGNASTASDLPVETSVEVWKNVVWFRSSTLVRLDHLGWPHPPTRQLLPFHQMSAKGRSECEGGGRQWSYLSRFDENMSSGVEASPGWRASLALNPAVHPWPKETRGNLHEGTTVI